jgi:hypothetical protein
VAGFLAANVTYAAPFLFGAVASLTGLLMMVVMIRGQADGDGRDYAQSGRGR